MNTPNQPPITDEYVAWLKEDAERLNRLCQEARAAGIVLPVGGGKPQPPLNPDGSLAAKKP